MTWSPEDDDEDIPK